MCSAVSILSEEHTDSHQRLYSEEDPILSRRSRLALALIGIAILLISLAVLAYTAWPAGNTREQYRLAPTVFAAPR